jgi:fido (protein-threonine AMPylation protein)
VNIGVPPNQIEKRLDRLLGDLEYGKGAGVPLIGQAAMLLHRAVSIHPFLNGNGRWSRLLANVWLKLHDHPTTDWPEDTLGDESTIRKEYLKTIHTADAGNYVPLIVLHKRFTPVPPKP